MSRRITRRSMLRRTTMASAGLMLAGVGTRVGSASPNEKLNVACIGIAGRGGANVKGVSGENIVALCDVDDKKAGNQYKNYPRAKKFYDFRRMLDQMEKEIDAVVVSTPDHTHFHPSMMAMRMGKHLYCEKPMAHAVWEVRAMTELAREKKLATQLGAQRHAIPNMHRVVELIQSGAIGEVREVHSWVGGSRGMPGMPKDRPEVPSHLKWDLWLGPAADRPYTPEYVPYKWRFWWDFGTGETGNWACHILDIPFWALKLAHPNRVKGSGPPPHIQMTPTSITTELQYPERDGLPPVTLHWYHTAKSPEALRKYNVSLGGANNLFVGSKGMLLCGFSKRKLFPVEKFADFEPPAPFVPDSPGFYREWINACKGGPPATCNFDYTGPMAESALLANLAYRIGEEMEWDAPKVQSPNCPVADMFIRPTYRKGWEM